MIVVMSVLISLCSNRPTCSVMTIMIRNDCISLDITATLMLFMMMIVILVELFVVALVDNVDDVFIFMLWLY